MKTGLWLTAWAICALCGCAHRQPAQLGEYRTPYNEPLTSPGAEFSAVPPAVQNAIRAEAGAADIAHILKGSDSGKTIYEVSFVRSDELPTLYIAPDGSVLNPDLTVAIGAAGESSYVLTGGPVSGGKQVELPDPVKKVVHDRAPNGKVSAIHTQTWGNQTVYVISFADEAHYPRLYITADGTVLNQAPN